VHTLHPVISAIRTAFWMHSSCSVCGGVLQCVAACCSHIYTLYPAPPSRCTAPAVCVAACVAVYFGVLQSLIHLLPRHLNYSHRILNASLVQCVLQCAAVCCSVLQCVLQCMLQCVAVCCSLLQCVAVTCTPSTPSFAPPSMVPLLQCVLQCVAVRCSVLQSHVHPLPCHLHYSHCLLVAPPTTHTATHRNTHCNTLQRTATQDNTHCLLLYSSCSVCCSVLQCVAVCVAVCCSVL